MFTYPIHGSGGIAASAFEQAVEALGPSALYLFRDSNFNTQVADSSGNGFHLALNSSTAAARGAKIRSTHPGGLVMPRTTGTNFTANGIQYLEASAGLAAELDGKAGMTTIFSCNLESFAVDGNHKMFGCSVLNSGASGTNDLFTCMQYAVDDDYMFKVHYVTGLVSAASIVTSVFDGTNYLFIGRRTNSPTEIDLESTDTAGTVQEWTGVGGAGVISSYAYKAVLGDPSARAGAAENAEAVIDHIAVFDTHLSDANVASLQSLWQAEEV